MGATPVIAHDYLMREYTAKEEGYVFMYVSNESATLVDVYFDDVVMTHTKGNIVQYNEYYPFGLPTSNSWTRENTTGNNFLGNGGTELNTTSNLYDLHYRNYDPTLGRMNQADPMATKFSSLTPYNFSFNNPVLFNDPLGDQPKSEKWNSIEESRKVDHDRNYYTAHGVLGDDDLYGHLFDRAGTLGYDYSVQTPIQAWSAHLLSIFPGDVYSLDFSITDFFMDGIKDSDHYVDSEVNAFWGGINLGSQSFNDPDAGYNWEKTWGAMFAEIRNRDRISDWVPVLGSIESADQALSQGRYVAAGGNLLLALSDMFLLKSIMKGIGQGGLTALTKGNLPWNAAPWKNSYRKHFVNSGFIKGTERGHHWFLHQNGKIGKYFPDFIKNQMFNIKVFADQTKHMTIGHGRNYLGHSGASFSEQIFKGTPSWVWPASFSTLGRIY